MAKKSIRKLGEKERREILKGSPEGRTELAKEKFLRSLEKKEAKAALTKRFSGRLTETAIAEKRQQLKTRKALKKRFDTPGFLKKGFGQGAISGVAGALTAMSRPQQPQGVSQGFAGRSSGGGSVPGRGRGRPEGSFTYSIPGVGPVPIAVYKKYLTQVKAQARLQRELQSAQLSATPPPDHVRGGMIDEMDQFVSADGQAEMMAQQQLMEQQAAAQMAARGGFGRGQGQGQGVGRGLRNAAARLAAMDRAPMGSPQVAQGQRFAGGAGSGVGQPQRVGLDVWGRGGSSILQAQNMFNNPGQTEVRP
ncbi:MAG: hypothetical protein GY861_23060 [bacterium]|nr:hypothetical protein [bacterium]